MGMVQGVYREETLSNSPLKGENQKSPLKGDLEGLEPITITCGMKRGQKKQFRNGKKDYKRMVDHIGLLPLVMVSPQDGRLIEDGSEERRRFLDVVISQHNKEYLNRLNTYNALLKQRNALLKEDDPLHLPLQRGREDGLPSSNETNLSPSHPEVPTSNAPWGGFREGRGGSSALLEVYELQMVPQAEYIYRERSRFVEQFIPLFQEIYSELSGDAEQVSLRYISQLQDRDLAEAYARTRERDRILGWTSQGIHKDEIEMLLGDYPLKRVGSQGQQKTYLLAMKLAQALYLGKPILLLDDIFDKLDSERVARIVRLVNSDRFGQIFITDTDRQHLTDLLRPTPEAKIFYVERGEIKA